MALSMLPHLGQAQRTRINVQPPTGWFGIRISDQARVDEQGNAFFDSYPVITGVDSGSPAAKAGVRPGDVLLAFNSHDMRGGSVELGKWLMAGAPFAVKIRRNGAPRVITGTLDRRPENWERNMIVRLSVPEMMERQKGSIGRELMPRTGMIHARMPVPEPLPSVLPPALGYGGGVYPFAGAEFTALNEDLSDALGVKPEGVFVMNVIEGSAAKAAGLRGGDIVLKADTIKIESPIDLVRAIRSANETDQQVVLQIIRKHKPETLTLRW
jgi:S1-C subfamily serine protease